jgi:hypothetical protein
MNHPIEYWLPESHPYTENSKYTGGNCSVCGKVKDLHTVDYILINGERLPRYEKISNN